MKTIKLIGVFFMLVLFSSCLKNENSIRFTDVVSLSAGVLPDTVTVNEEILLPFSASAPNSCWYNLQFVHEVQNDTNLMFAAVGTYENNGEACAEVLQIKDSVFKFTPTQLKSLVVHIYSANEPVKKDTIVVIAE